MTTDDLGQMLDRESVLGGLPTRRAQTLLFLMERRAAQAAAQSRQAASTYLAAAPAEDREEAFLDAFGARTKTGRRASIQEIERYTPAWRSLVPDNPRILAALAHLLGAKYRFRRAHVPGLRRALLLDDEPVLAAYDGLYHAPLSSIYAGDIRFPDRLRWTWTRLASRLENLSPFWIAFALSLTETIGVDIFALPLVLAHIGPLAGVGLMVIVGLINVLTVSFVAEAVVRNGNMRSGSAFFGRLVSDYLGRLGAGMFTSALAVMYVIWLLACYVGLAKTMAGITPIAAAIWVLPMLLGGLFLLSRGSLEATIASALVVGAVDLCLLLVLAIAAATHIHASNLTYSVIPPFSGSISGPTLGLIFGVALVAYLGHTSAATCAGITLHRDPGGRSLIRGCMAAQVAAIALYCFWVLATDGAVSAATLRSQSGTVLVPLAHTIGPVVYVLGAVLAVLELGLGSVYASLGLFNLVREWLPTRARVVVTLVRRQGRVVLTPRGARGGGLPVGLTFMGLFEGQPLFRLDLQIGNRIRQVEVVCRGYWDSTSIRDQIPEFGGRAAGLSIECLEADEREVRISVTTAMAISYRGGQDESGVGAGGILAMDGDQARLVGWILRQGPVRVGDVAHYLDETEARARNLIEALIATGAVTELHERGEIRYRVQIGLRRGRAMPADIWTRLQGGDAPAFPSATDPPRTDGTLWTRARNAAVGKRGAFMAGISPIIAVSLMTEWLLLAGAVSFAGVLSALGILVGTLVAGIFPALLLLSSRRKGDCAPSDLSPRRGSLFLIVPVYSLFLVTLLLHGIVVWNGPLERIAAIAESAAVISVTVLAIRRGAFSRRLVAELRADHRTGEVVVHMSVGGTPVSTELSIVRATGTERQPSGSGIGKLRSLQRLSFDVSSSGPGAPSELKIWAHEMDAGGGSEPMPIRAEIQGNGHSRVCDLQLLEGQVVVPLAAHNVHVSLVPSVAAEADPEPPARTSRKMTSLLDSL